MRRLKDTVYAEKTPGQFVPLTAHATEAQLRKDEPWALQEGVLGDHVWEEKPEDEAADEVAVGDAQALAQARTRIGELDSLVEDLRAEISVLQGQAESTAETQQAEIDRLREQLEDRPPAAPDETSEPPQPAVPTEAELKKLNKAGLLAAAEAEGVELDENDTNPQIVDKIVAARSGAGS